MGELPRVRRCVWTLAGPVGRNGYEGGVKFVSRKRARPGNRPFVLL